jgi:hypothetical protein
MSRVLNNFCVLLYKCASAFILSEVSEIDNGSDIFDVILGLDPRIHNPLKSMYPRVKPEDDGGRISGQILSRCRNCRRLYRCSCYRVNKGYRIYDE